MVNEERPMSVRTCLEGESTYNTYIKGVKALVKRDYGARIVRLIRHSPPFNDLQKTIKGRLTRGVGTE